MKVLPVIVIMMLLNPIVFSQTISNNTTCIGAIGLCDTNSIEIINSMYYRYTWNLVGDNCDPIAPMYYGMQFNQSGNMSFFGTGNADFILFGPISETLEQSCNLISTYNTPYVEGSLSLPFDSYNFFYEPGLYVLQIMVQSCQGVIDFSGEDLGNNLNCTLKPDCRDCITSFQPTPGRYIVSAWVKEKNAPIGTTHYDNPSLGISFTNASLNYTLEPTGKIIDGWQRIEGEIFVPYSATGIDLSLRVTSGEAYFDDIRFFPFDGSMMSYVYDPESLRLMAELDERNYATFYEYDEEGKLIRVKKETEKGVMTIQENRDNIKK